MIILVTPLGEYPFHARLLFRPPKVAAVIPNPDGSLEDPPLGLVKMRPASYSEFDGVGGKLRLLAKLVVNPYFVSPPPITALECVPENADEGWGAKLRKAVDWDG